MNELVINGYKRCSKCGETKEFSEFTLCKKSKDGHFSWCKQCKNKGGRKEKNKDFYNPAPECACGCGGNVIWRPNLGKWNTFISGHQNKARSNPKRPEENPLCACGCGEPVNWNKGKKDWSKYKSGHNYQTNPNKLKDPPLCACGCGRYTNWDKNTKEYHKYIHPHQNEYISQLNSGENANNYKHGLSKYYLYKLWKDIKYRCLPNYKKHLFYYDKGVRVCDEWLHDPVSFYNWALSNGWEEGLTIDRDDNDKGYSPDNCRFVTMAVNNWNRGLLQSNNTSGYRSVRICDNGTYSYQIRSKFKNINKSVFGFLTVKDAAIARDKFVLENNIPHKLNFPELKENND